MIHKSMKQVYLKLKKRFEVSGGRLNHSVVKLSASCLCLCLFVNNHIHGLTQWVGPPPTIMKHADTRCIVPPLTHDLRTSLQRLNQQKTIVQKEKAF